MTPEEARAVMAARTAPSRPWVKGKAIVRGGNFGIPQTIAGGSATLAETDANAIALAVNTWDALMDVADAARRYHTAEWAIRFAEDESVLDPGHNERVEELRSANTAFSAASDALAARLEAER